METALEGLVLSSETTFCTKVSCISADLLRPSQVHERYLAFVVNLGFVKSSHHDIRSLWTVLCTSNLLCLLTVIKGVRMERVKVG